MRSVLSTMLVIRLATGCATIHGPRNIDDVSPGAMAAQHPQVFSTIGAAGSFVQDDVRVGREGVFVANRRHRLQGAVTEGSRRRVTSSPAARP